MNNYRFKFRYVSKGCKASGNGTCRALNIVDAFEVARKAVASDFGGPYDNIAIISMSQYKPRKKKAKEQSS